MVGQGSMSIFKTGNTFYNTHILLVDDNPDLLFVFDFFLKSEGYGNVKTCPNSKIALKYAMENIKKYKLAILDIRMPDISGIQLCQILKILNPSIKIIFLTCIDEVYELTRIFSDVVYNDILKKPVDRIDFIEKVNYKIKKDVLMV